MSVDKSPQRVRRMFGEIAPRYDFLNRLLSGGVDRYWRWQTVRWAPPQGDLPVLDVCTGTADLALAYWRAGKRRLRVVGADFCRPMLALGRRKIDRRGAAGCVDLLEADAQQLPFADDAFQIVSVAFGLRNVADTDRGLAEMTRVCRRGGRVVVLEFSMPTRPPVRAVYRWYFERVLPKIGQALTRNRQSAYAYLPESVGGFPQGEALAARMVAAGLRDVRIRRFTFGIATLYIGTK